jgi:hypothetical protein
MRLQTSLEFLLTYSWAMLVIGLFLSTVFLISLSHPVQSYIPSQCSITPLLPCLDTVLTTSPNLFTMVFQNNLGQALYFPSSAFNVITTGTEVTGSQSSLGSCAPLLLPVGGEAVCTATIPGSIVLPTGTQFLVSFIITYELCGGNTFSSCNTPTYSTTGSSLQMVSPSTTSLYAVTFNVVSGSGTIVLNGVSYPNNDVAYFVSGNYVIFAQPALGHSFTTWGITSTSSTIAPPYTAQNTVLTLSSNAVLKATFT